MSKAKTKTSRIPLATGRLASSVLFALVITLSGGHVLAQEEKTVPVMPPAVAVILQKAMDAVADRETRDRFESLRCRAECRGPNGPYQTETVTTRSGVLLFHQRSEEQPVGNIVIGLSGLAWRMVDRPERFELVSSAEKTVVDLHLFQRMTFDPESLFTGFAMATPIEIPGGTKCDRISATMTSGDRCHLLFDPDNHRLLGYDFLDADLQPIVSNRFSDWKAVDGYTLPMTVTAVDELGEWVLEFDSIDINTDVWLLPINQDRLASLAGVTQRHLLERTAHVTYDAELFASLLFDPSTQLRAGEVAMQARGDNLERFRAYFDSVRFESWDDLAPPMIELSMDGSMASIVVRKDVRTRSSSDPDSETSGTHFAWLEVWRQFDGEWLVTTIASTRMDTQDSRNDE